MLLLQVLKKLMEFSNFSLIKLMVSSDRWLPSQTESIGLIRIRIKRCLRQFCLNFYTNAIVRTQVKIFLLRSGLQCHQLYLTEIGDKTFETAFSEPKVMSPYLVIYLTDICGKSENDEILAHLRYK